jgi:hypothetical protein
MQINAPVHVGTSVFHGWTTLEYPPAGWTDTFIFSMQHDSGLPPGDYAQLLKKLTWQLNKLRKGASIWVQVDGPGMWYGKEVRRVLRGLNLPVAVTSTGVSQPKLESFNWMPYTLRVPSGPPPLAADWYLGDLSGEQLTCLRVLARLQKGYTKEIAALQGCGNKKVRSMLRMLVEKGYALYTTDFVNPARPKRMIRIGGKEFCCSIPGEKRKYPFWQITKKGISIALRSWGLPPNYYFPERKEFRTPPDRKHRRIARQWLAWVRKAWSHAEIWTGWSEVKIKRLAATPDALAWGRLDGWETLFWLEVESGHSSREVLQTKLSRRLNQAYAYTQSLNVRLVFVLLAMPWVQEAARPILAGVPDTMAIVTGDWNEFGRLPVVEWGKVRLATEHLWRF